MKIVIIGPIFDSPSGPRGEGGKLYTKLLQNNWKVYKRSKHKNKILRFFDTIFFLVFFSNKYDLILMQTFLGNAFKLEFICFIIAKLLNKKYFSVIHGGAFIEFYEHNSFWSEYFFRRVDKIITPSSFIKKYLESKHYEVEYIPNFIDKEKFPFNAMDNFDYRILWVRAFHDIYQPEFAIHLIAQLKKNYPNIHLTMIGPDHQPGKLEACQTLIDKLDLDDCIEIVGFVPNHDLYKFFHNHDIFINTTRYESFGVALLEAASCGIPIVSTGVGEIPILWKDEEEMLIIKENNVENLAAQVIRLLEDRCLRLKLKRNARIKVEQFFWDIIAIQWMQVLQKDNKL